MAAEAISPSRGGIAPGPQGRASLAAPLLGASLLAGVAAWGLGEGSVSLVRPVVHQIESKGPMLVAVDRWSEFVAAMANAGLAFALLGGLLGAAAGAVGGRAAGSTRRALVAAGVGLALGVVVESALSAAILTPYGSYRYRHPDEASQDLILPILVYPGIWAGAGLAAGLALAFGGGRRGAEVGRFAVGGAVGAALAGAVFLLVEAFAFPSGDTIRFVSATGPVRLGARLAVALGAAAFLISAVAGRPGSARVAPTAPPAPGSDQGAGSTTV